MRCLHGPSVAAVIVGIVTLTSASPAAADPAEPTDDRSEIQSIDPPTDAISIEVVGGDGFLHLSVARGHEVIVEGYDGEPWLRIAADGTVAQNINSPATYLNADRYAEVSGPDVDPDAPPEFEVMGDDGDHVWHDHRIHWMSPDRPQGLRPGETIFDDWTVPMTVDGDDVTVHGTLVWERDENPLIWAAIAVAALGAVVLVARRRAVLTSAVATTAVATLAVVIGIGQRSATPAAAGGTPLVIVIPALALVAGGVAIGLRRRPAAVISLLAAVALLLGWSLLRIQVLLHPVLPTNLPFALFDRFGTAASLGVAVAAAYAVIAAGGLRSMELHRRTDNGRHLRSAND